MKVENEFFWGKHKHIWPQDLVLSSLKSSSAKDNAYSIYCLNQNKKRVQDVVASLEHSRHTYEQSIIKDVTFESSKFKTAKIFDKQVYKNKTVHTSILSDHSPALHAWRLTEKIMDPYKGLKHNTILYIVENMFVMQILKKWNSLYGQEDHYYFIDIVTGKKAIQDMLLFK